MNNYKRLTNLRTIALERDAYSGDVVIRFAIYRNAMDDPPR
jgi:hypothetical protein